MPRLDGTGPMGRGAMTGGGFGPCGRGYGARPRFNLRRGAGRGWGFHQAYGYGPGYGRGYYGVIPDEGRDKDYLESQKEFLQNELNAIQDELDNL